MSKTSRIVGKNIELAVKRKYANVEDFRMNINLSQRDLERLFTGRLLLNPKKIKEVSQLLEVSVLDLLNTDKDYTFVHAYGEFSDRENEHKILDFIDDYIDLVEISGGANNE